MTTEVSQVITCPSCGAEIKLTEAFLYPFQQEWKRQWEAESKPKLDAEKEKALEEKNKTIEELRSEVKHKDNELEKAQNYERELRNKVKKIEAREKALDLEVERKLDEEKKKIGEKHNIELLEKNKQLSNMQQQIDELKKRSEQISPQTRGDALQYELERILKLTFADDEIQVIKRGVKGADVIQKVKDRGTRLCGTILWESKNTKRWNNSWIDKLKNDQRNQKADIAVLASITIPEGIQNFGMIQGVWVTCLPVACCLADVLRFSLIEIATNRLASVDRDQKIEALYDYLSSPHFKQRIEPIVEALGSMYQELNHEKRAMESIWAQREKEIDKAIKATARFYGDIRGIIGGTFLPQIEGLRLLSPAED